MTRQWCTRYPPEGLRLTGNNSNLHRWGSSIHDTRLAESDQHSGESQHTN